MGTRPAPVEAAPRRPLFSRWAAAGCAVGVASAMVLESVVADLLNRFLGDYVENLNKSQLKLGIWGGKEPPSISRRAAGPPLSPGAGASRRRGGERVSLAAVPP